MPNYKSTTVGGDAWTRCHTVTIRNPLAGVPRIEFAEEQVIAIGDKTLHQWTDCVNKDFASDGTFPLLDPTTNATTGATMTHAQLYVALYSLYMQTAAERDAQEPTP